MGYASLMMTGRYGTGPGTRDPGPDRDESTYPTCALASIDALLESPALESPAGPSNSRDAAQAAVAYEQLSVLVATTPPRVPGPGSRGPLL